MRTRLVSAIVLALTGVAFTSTALAANAAPMAQTTTQLPRAVRPSHYAVSISPHPSSLSFDGKVTVDVEVLAPTSTITLNALDLSFSKAQLTAEKSAVAMLPKVSTDNDAQTVTFTFDKPLARGKYQLSMSYRGKIATQPNGLFAIDYDSKAGKKRALYTQFENSDARRFIPSWDEPNYKATFDLDVTVPSGDMAVSNMPVASKTDAGNGLSHITFKTSPKMSTYLLFFGTGEFDRITTTSDGVEIGVVTQKGLSSQAAFTLESGKAVLKEYNDYFGVPYPLPKLDNIASPGSSQFFSAMENWGAIYTFEYSLLLDPSISTQSDKQWVFSVAAHEMAHQWFGDLVTMRWWDDLWLNEGFASWMASRTTDRLHPEWNTRLDAVAARERAMARDAVVTTHPVVQHVATVEQASQAFDVITYLKGRSVIRMLEAYVGPENWRTGVRNYIKAHAYGNSVSDDLWQAMDAAAPGKHVSTVAHDFTLQPGVPLIRVEPGECVNHAVTLKLSQGEFTKDRPEKQPLRWHVPVVAQSIGGKPVSALVDGTATLTVPGCGPVLVNAGQSGYYRTLYSSTQEAAIAGSFARLAPIDQLGVMGDTWALGMAGLQPVSDFLDLAKATSVDADPQIWDEVAGRFAALDDYYRGDARRQQAFRAFATKRLSPVFARVGWEAKPNESVPTTILRSHLIGVLSTLGDNEVIAEARRRYAAQATDARAVPAELRKTILAVVAGHADAATWDQLHAAAKAERTPLVKDNLYAQLASTEDTALAKRALDLALSDEPGATNSAGMIDMVSRLHPELAFDFALAHREQVDKLLDGPSRSGYYPSLGTNSFDAAMVDKINDYAAKYVAATSRRDAETAVANIKYRMMVRNERLPAVDEWLSKNGS
ncbi:M1 family metallopeptidase [Dyella halodurans]|uniref:Aminopeptidase n=1 Tax=Dyella halodurans TaxID=1920171 RepID=A0ABV9C029_9GAMM|nr:M1 family metallopeptidase [Dyella halodurans]